jgi:hypothetical protein
MKQKQFARCTYFHTLVMHHSTHICAACSTETHPQLEQYYTTVMSQIFPVTAQGEIIVDKGIGSRLAPINFQVAWLPEKQAQINQPTYLPSYLPTKQLIWNSWN